MLQQQDKVKITEATTRLNLNIRSKLEEWTLHQFIEVAGTMKLISSQTATLSTLAKDFRNLIHPARVQRLGQTCNRGTALSAVAAVEHVVLDLMLSLRSS